MRKKTTVYKAVRRDHEGRLLSAFISRYTQTVGSDLCLTYKPNTITKPNVGKLFAFSNKEDAFAYLFGDEVWKAQATGVKKLGKHEKIFTGAQLILDNYEYFWKYGVSDCFEGLQQVLGYAPKGTVLCETIKLIEN